MPRCLLGIDTGTWGGMKHDVRSYMDEIPAVKIQRCDGLAWSISLMRTKQDEGCCLEAPGPSRMMAWTWRRHSRRPMQNFRGLWVVPGEQMYKLSVITMSVYAIEDVLRWVKGMRDADDVKLKFRALGVH